MIRLYLILIGIMAVTGFYHGHLFGIAQLISKIIWYIPTFLGVGYSLLILFAPEFKEVGCSDCWICTTYLSKKIIK